MKHRFFKMARKKQIIIKNQGWELREKLNKKSRNIVKCIGNSLLIE